MSKCKNCGEQFLSPLTAKWDACPYCKEIQRVNTKERPTKEEYFMALAVVVAQRSEDPCHQVGAVAATSEGRIIATAYNGLQSSQVMPATWWNDKGLKRKIPIHAEENLCSLFIRGQVETVAITLSPCVSCFRLLVAHGVEKVIYKERHKSFDETLMLAQFYDVALIQL